MENPWRVLVLFAHQRFESSRVQKRLLDAITGMENVEIRDLYRLYPDFFIDVAAEKEALLRSTLVIFQHPINWYSLPAMLKEWQDVVLERGFAYGDGGTQLVGKDFMSVVSSGGTPSAYAREGRNRFTLPELLRPLEATAHLCGMRYCQPFVVPGAFAIDDTTLLQQAVNYRTLLRRYLSDGPNALVTLNTAAINCSAKKQQDQWDFSGER